VRLSNHKQSFHTVWRCKEHTYIVEICNPGGILLDTPVSTKLPTLFGRGGHRGRVVEKLLFYIQCLGLLNCNPGRGIAIARYALRFTNLLVQTIALKTVR
jgi:hypothetical protein